MADKNRKSTQFIPGWPTSHAPKNTTESVKTSSVHEEALDLVQINELQQGQLYIVKIKLIAIALFQGIISLNFFICFLPLIYSFFLKKRLG